MLFYLWGVSQEEEEKKKLQDRIDDALKEIERLKENNQAMQEEMVRTWKKLDEKESKIKEVREYIINHREAVDERGEHIIYFLKDNFDEEDILEILDKVGD